MRRIPLANFVGVVGLSPQVVSETFYCLTVESKSPPVFQRIRLLTTRRGQRLVEAALLDPKVGALHRLQSDHSAARRALAAARIEIEVLRDGSGRPMSDIFTSEQSVAAADQIYRAVLELIRDADVPLIASVAGGRKTMGIYLAMAMELAGRPQDRLLHVLVRDPFDRDRGFFYPGPDERRKRTPTSASPLSLVDLPFLRTGSLLDRDRLLRGFRAGGAAGLLRSVQRDLERSCAPRQIRIDLRKRVVEVGGFSASLTPREIAFYWHLCEETMAAGRSGDGVAVQDLTRSVRLRDCFRRAERGLRAAREREDPKGAEAWEYPGGLEGLRQLRSKINRKLRASLTPEIASQYEILSSGPRFEKRYLVPAARTGRIEVAPRRASSAMAREPVG